MTNNSLSQQILLAWQTYRLNNCEGINATTESLMQHAYLQGWRDSTRQIRKELEGKQDERTAILP